MAKSTPRPKRCRQMYVVAMPVMLGVEDNIELPPAGLLRLRGASAEIIEQAMEMPHRVVVIDEVALKDGARSALETRKAALGLAENYDGIAIDMFVPQILTLRKDEVSIEASAQWFCFSYEDGTTFTHGLERFGLPEIKVSTMDSAQGVVDAVIVGLVHALVRYWPDMEPEGVQEVRLSDISRGYGQYETIENDRSIQVAVEYDEPHLVATFLDDPRTTLFAE